MRGSAPTEEGAPMAAEPQRLDVKSIAMLLALSVLWGGSFFFVGVAVTEIPPLTLVALRVGCAAAMLWAALAARGPQPGLDLCNLGSGQPIALRQFIEALVAELARHGFAAQCRIGALPYRASEPMVSLPDLSRWQAKGLRRARVSLAEGVADLVAAELAG